MNNDIKQTAGNPRVIFIRRLVLASLGLLLVVLFAINYLSALLLLPFAYGVVKQSWRTHIWLCFVLLFYFLFNINKLAGEHSWLDYAEGALIVILFVAAMLYCRWSKSVPSSHIDSSAH